MNSFISDAKFKQGVLVGPPCCSPTITQSGTGVDKYYLTLTFDNTENNPNLNNIASTTSTDDNLADWDYNQYWFIDLDSGYFPNYDGGLFETDDGVTPDALKVGQKDFHNWDTFTMRFTLNGILTYKWTLKNLNAGDVWPDFIGTATYPATGYGYVAKVCSLIDGSVTITERLVADSDCCSVIDTIDIGEDTYTGWELSRGLYGELDGFYTHSRGHYHAFNDWIFYHAGFNNNYQDYKEWFEYIAETAENYTPNVVEEENLYEGKLWGFDLAPLLP
jgi:hypothetical protein